MRVEACRGERMKHPKWKQRQLDAKKEREAAEAAARHKAFWEAVPQPKRLIEEHDYRECTTWGWDANGSPVS
jgi:hypothetical protein